MLDRSNSLLRRTRSRIYVDLLRIRNANASANFPLGTTHRRWSQQRFISCSILHRILSPAFGIVTLAGVSATQVQAENSRGTLSWENYDNKDALTDKITHEVVSEFTFQDGSIMQTAAKCGQIIAGRSYPGLTIVVTTFKKGGSQLSPFAWRNGTVLLPVLINDQPQSGVRAYSENPRANLIPIGFYDPAAAERYAHGEQAPMMKLQALNRVAEIQRTAEWQTFVSGTGGTLVDLLQATSFRVQLPLADGSANVVEINPQDSLLKSFVQQCSSRMQAARPSK